MSHFPIFILGSDLKDIGSRLLEHTVLIIAESFPPELDIKIFPIYCHCK